MPLCPRTIAYRQKARSLSPFAICVPVRDEAAELPRLLAALDRLAPARDTGPIHVCLLLDGCTDASPAIARGYAGASPHRVRIAEAPRGPANAGRARHRAMLLGLDALGEQGSGGRVLTTDADSAPAPDWLAAMAAGLAAADVVAGRIARAATRPSPALDRLEAYYDALFALRRGLDPVPWEAARIHHYAGGANLGLRADAYRALGGFAPLATAEDARLVDEAARAGLRVRRDADALVLTSDRRVGRAGGGLAAALRGLDAGDAAVRVAHPDDAAWQYRMHAAMRADHAADRLDRAAVRLGLDLPHVLGVARDCPNAEAFAMRIVPTPPGGMRELPLGLAERALAALAAGIREPVPA